MANAETIMVEVAYALPTEQHLLRLQLPAGSTMQAAVNASGLAARFPDIASDTTRFGLFGKIEKAPATCVLKSGDRVEIYRPLAIDPKEARKARVAKAKSKRQGF